MSQDIYTIALNTSLTELKRICPNVRTSCFFSKEGNIIAGEPESNDLTPVLRHFQALMDKAETIGQLDTLFIQGENGKVYFSIFANQYLFVSTSENADITHLQSITHIIFPTIFKLLEAITPTPLQFVPSTQLSVESYGGFFAGDSVLLDETTLKAWSTRLKREAITEVEIEASGGQTVECKVKELSDSASKGKGIIRMPEKLCKKLNIENGATVKVRPKDA